MGRVSASLTLLLLLAVAPPGLAARARQPRVKLVTNLVGLLPASGADFNGVVVSPDGRRLAYVSSRGAKSCLMVDGQKDIEFDEVRAAVFSPDGKRVAYAARRTGKWLVVLDGEEGKEYDAIGEVAFSADGKHLAYAAQRAGKWLVVLDEQEGRE